MTSGSAHSTSGDSHSRHLQGSHGKERMTSVSAHSTNGDAHSRHLQGSHGKERMTSVSAHSTSIPHTINKEKRRNAQGHLTHHGKDNETKKSRPPKPMKSKLLMRSASAPSPNINAHMEEPVREANSEPVENENESGKQTKAKRARVRRVKQTNLQSDWPDEPDFDEKEEVLIIDREGKRMKLSGPVQARNIDTLDVGLRCVVNFSDLNQPIRKGGYILVKYLGSLARNKRFCPIGEKTWNDIHPQFKAEIIQLVRSKFLIPDGDTYNKAILMRVAKHWRQYKHALKDKKFNPKDREKEEIYKDVPDGQELNQWIRLVDYWYSEESKGQSKQAKEARASKSHVHITGSTSYANKRADFVESKGRQPSHLEFFKLTHTKHDGGFVDNTISSEFLVKANEQVQEHLKKPGSSKAKVEIENAVFEKLMYEDGKPKRPVGFGLGVKESDVFGVSFFLRQTSGGAGSMTNSMEVEHLKSKLTKMEVENGAAITSLKMENQELRAKVDQSNQMMLHALDAIRTGRVKEFMEAATLDMADSQVASTSGDSEESMDEM